MTEYVYNVVMLAKKEPKQKAKRREIKRKILKNFRNKKAGKKFPAFFCYF